MANFIKFFKQSVAPENVAGNIWFDKSTNLIKVGNGTSWEEFGGVVDAKFENSVLTIRKANATAFTLDFSDVASSEGVNKILSGVADRLESIDSSISTINQNITNLDASYKAADTSLKNDLLGGASTDYNTLGKLQAKIEAEASTRSTEDASVLKAAKEYADTKGAAATTKVVEGTDAGDNMTIESSTEADGATKYTISLTNVASASALSAHTGDGDIHVTTKQKTDWQAATDAINLFFDKAGMNSEDASAFVDTLKEIQDYITGDAEAAATMAGNITKAQNAADAAQADVDAVEKALGTGFSEASTVAAQLAAVKTTADEAATKDALKAVTDSYVISFGGAKGAISVDTENADQGHVKFTMDGSTLKGAVNGLGTAAFKASTEFDAAGAATTAKNEVIGETGDASNKVTLYGVKAYADALKADADSSIDALQTLVGSTNVSTQISSAIAELDSTLDATDGKYVEKVVIVDGKIDTAASVVKSLPAATVDGVDPAAKSSNYVSIATSLVDKKVVVTPTVTLQDVSTAGDNAKGLAEASDVKSYVDNQIATNALSWVVLE